MQFSTIILFYTHYWTILHVYTKLRVISKNFFSVGLQTAISSRFTGTENLILKTVAMKNSMHYSKQNTANAARVTAALASFRQQLHTRLQSLCFVPCNAIYYWDIKKNCLQEGVLY